MERIRFVVLRLATFGSDTQVALYGDLGSGSIDFSHALPPGKVSLWSHAMQRGHLEGGHITSRHLDAVDLDGHLAGGHLLTGHLEPVVAFALHSPRYVFGRFRHTLRMTDGAGNVSDEAEQVFEHTVNSAPRAPSRLRYRGIDAVSQQLTLSFLPVRFAAVAGA